MNINEKTGVNHLKKMIDILMSQESTHRKIAQEFPDLKPIMGADLNAFAYNIGYDSELNEESEIYAFLTYVRENKHIHSFWLL